MHSHDNISPNHKGRGLPSNENILKDTLRDSNMQIIEEEPQSADKISQKKPSVEQEK